MSEEAFGQYTSARDRQLKKNDALRIRTKIHEARRSPADSGPRWPFELIQNAVDPGPRVGRGMVSVSFNCKDSTLRFSHDGAPFSSQDLAALLSGGSSKEFDSSETTGRFGTGFLATHALSTSVEVRGFLAAGPSTEQFTLQLERSGDEEAILENINHCDEAIRRAARRSLDDVPTAEFEYANADAEAAKRGLETLARSAPYLFATCPTLGSIEIRKDEERSCWRAGPCETGVFKGGEFKKRLITQESVAGSADLAVTSISASDSAGATAIVVLERQLQSWRVLIPPEEAPRLFFRFPLRATTYVGLNLVLNASFDVDQERRGILFSEQTLTLFRSALDAAALAIELGIQEQWTGLHALARIKAVDKRALSNEEDVHALNQELELAAGRVARAAIVATDKGLLPADRSINVHASFPVASLFSSAAGPEVPFMRAWKLATLVSDLTPPEERVASDWTETSIMWKELGVNVDQVSLSELARRARGSAKKLGELRIGCPPLEWLANFIDVVGEAWDARHGVETSVFEGLLPNQREDLSSPDELRRDGGIPEDLKAIAEEIGIDVKPTLLSTALAEVEKARGFGRCLKALERLIPEEVTEKDLVERCIVTIEKALVPGRTVVPENAPKLRGCIRLIDYIWRTRGQEAGDQVGRLPVITSERRVERNNPNRIMSPVCTWSEAARPFSSAYPANRVLCPEYAGGQDLPNVVGALCAWGIAIPDPLVTSREVEELKGVRLETASGIVNRGQVVHGATVRNVTFSQVALLNEIQQGCGERLEQAKALIGLVLSYIAPNDGGWRTEREVKANTGASIRLCPAIWLADLLNPSRAWVPSPGADGSHVALAATSTSIGPLLDSRWLNEASIELLSKHFGFGRLELQLLVASPDEAKRSDLKDALARLVEVGGANAGFYTELAGRVEEQKRRERELNRLRNMGLAVQGAVESAMKAHRLQLKFEDCGFDYEVSEDPIADPSIRMQFGTYLLEVKATTTGEVRLTSKQAATASEEANRFVLCVVDLRGMPLEELDRTWTPQDVEPRAKILAGVGSKVATPHGLVEAASTSEVRVRNESALRYAVSDELWFAGISISAWVEGIRASLKPSAAG